MTTMWKGVETEIIVGDPDGRARGLSPGVADRFDDFDVEPDARNVEHVTEVHSSLAALRADLLEARQRLRRWLAQAHGATLHPGATLSLGDEGRFLRSKPSDPYHSYIERTYGTRVVTASLHVNLGPPELKGRGEPLTADQGHRFFRMQRALRADAALILALTASSPFAHGRRTGWDSTRWHQFPETPVDTPVLLGREHYKHWMETHLARGTMVNERHHWASVRPNGPDRPDVLDRIEVRIADIELDLDRVLAVVAFLDSMATEAWTDPAIDPLDLSDLDRLIWFNERAAAKTSLDGRFRDWRLGAREVTAREAIAWRIDRWIAHGTLERCFAETLGTILEGGNRAMEWRTAVASGRSVEDVFREAITRAEEDDRRTAAEDHLVSPPVTPAPSG